MEGTGDTFQKERVFLAGLLTWQHQGPAGPGSQEHPEPEASPGSTLQAVLQWNLSAETLPLESTLKGGFPANSARSCRETATKFLCIYSVSIL